MGARVLYNGRGITELREWARDLKITGRWKMNGWELERACQRQNLANLRATEEALIKATGGIEVGMLLRYADGTTIRVTGAVMVSAYQTRYVHGEYVLITSEYAPGMRTDVEHWNRMQPAHRHFLHSLAPVNGHVRNDCPAS